MRHEISFRSLCQLNYLLNYNYTTQKNIEKITSDLFVFRCQKYSIGKLIFYAGGEYKILHRQFLDRNTLQISFFFFYFFYKKSRRIRNSRIKDFPFE